MTSDGLLWSIVIWGIAIQIRWAAMITIAAIWHLFAVMGPLRIWYAVPIITSVSLVYAATRHEDMGQIMIHAARFAVWIVVFMAIVFAALQVLSFLQ